MLFYVAKNIFIAIAHKDLKQKKIKIKEKVKKDISFYNFQLQFRFLFSCLFLFFLINSRFRPTQVKKSSDSYGDFLLEK
ncbi:hypothetical protein BpHYR1_004045 [Brachionus plicatilis]|uniref:Uncharacterized protein n=1 Tax=Brachionus plicatilis TaxID=10195 RepID=A0A3M7RSN7_BRAPC|nr:hypothetical protein BpHYR1_004045 [Brachionus plicatilis]